MGCPVGGRPVLSFCPELVPRIAGSSGNSIYASIPESEWRKVEDEAFKFWDEKAQESERNARVVEILKQYTETMRQAGPPYRYGS